MKGESWDASQSCHQDPSLVLCSRPTAQKTHLQLDQVLFQAVLRPHHQGLQRQNFPTLSPLHYTVLIFCCFFFSSATLTRPDYSSLVKRCIMIFVCASSIVAWKMTESSEQGGWRPLKLSWSYLKHFMGVSGGGLAVVYFFSFRARWRSLVDRQGVSRLCAISAAAGFLMRSLFVKSTQGGLNECLAFAL